MAAVDLYTNPRILTARLKSFSVTELNKKTKKTDRTTTQPMTKTAMNKSNLTSNSSDNSVSCSSSLLKSAIHENATQIVICKKKKAKYCHDHSLRKQPTIPDVVCTQTLL